MEQIRTDAARARVGEQHAAGGQQLEGEAVDVFVGPRCALSVRNGGGGANLGGSKIMASKVRPSAANLRKEAFTSASIKVARLASNPFKATLAAAVSNAGADESMEVTWAAPPVRAATVKPPV